MDDVKTPGTFTLEFYLDKNLIYKFPFSISKLPGVKDADPLDNWFLDGPWERYAYLFYLGGNPDMTLRFNTWLRNKERKPRKEVKVLGVILKDGAPIAKTSEQPQKLTLTPEWQHFEFDIGKSVRDNSGKVTFTPVKAKDFLGTPGEYQLLLTIDNQLYGTYAFTVTKDGTFRLLPRQTKDYTPEEQRIYAGKGTVWLERK